MDIARDIRKQALSVCLTETLVYCAATRLSCFRYGTSVMNAYLKAIFLGGSALLLAACETTLPDAGSPTTAHTANSLLSPDEDKTAPVTPSDNAVASSMADGDAMTPTASDQAVNTEIPAERIEAMPLPADQTASKDAAQNKDAPAETTAETTTETTADTIDEAFDIAAGSLTPPPAPPEDAPEISEPEPAPPPAEFEPASIVGLSADQLEARFGSADLLRREGTAEVWQYRLSACVVDYFVYPDAAGIRKIVAWDWRAPVLSADIDALKCRQDLAIRDQTTGQG